MLNPSPSPNPNQLRDVWISGNDAVVTDDACGIYLPHHGVQVSPGPNPNPSPNPSPNPNPNPNPNSNPNSNPNPNPNLPHHGVQVPLHHNLPEERLPQRRADGRIRRVGYADGGGEAEEGEGGGEGEIEGEIEGEGEIVISLGQLFFANYYSFLADALARLVLARDALPPSQAARLPISR